MGTIWRVLTRKKVVGPDADESTRLARVLNTFDLTALGVGSTLGVGVYVLAGHVARDTAGPAVVLSFLIAAIASVFAGLCYAEFGARTPKAGSAYVYSYVCVGEFVAFVIGWNLILEYVIGSASVARGLSLYLDTLLNNTLQNTFREIAPIDNVSFLSAYFDFFSFGIAVVLSVGLAFGMKESTWLNNLFTIINIGVVLFVIIAGSFEANPENWNVPANVSDPTVGEGGFFPFGVEGMIKGAATCFYGFVGFDCIATTGEEVKNPKRAIPIAIVVSLAIIFLSYFGTSTVITMMVPYYAQDINAPIPHAFEDVGWYVAKWIVSIGGIFGLCASLFGAMFPLPRIIYAMASDRLIFEFLGSISSRFSTPVVGTLLAGLLTGLLSALFELRQLVNMMSIGTLLAYTIVAACVLLLRYTDSIHAGTENSTANPEPHVEDANDDRRLINGESISFSSSFKQLFNGRGLRSPSRLSEKLAAIHVCIFCFLALLLGLCAMFFVDEIQHGRIYAIVLTSVVGFLIILVVMSLSMQPTSNRVLSFKVPFVPLIPALSILINIYLMLMLDGSTWIRFGIWMLLGIPIYIFSVRSYSHARNTVISEKSLSNGHANGSAKSNSAFNYASDEAKTENTELQEEKAISIVDSGIDSYSQKTPVYGSIRSIDNVESPQIDIQTYHEKKSISSIDVALAELDDVLIQEEQASQFMYLNVDVASRKTSADTISVASHVPVQENVVALVHREDVIASAPYPDPNDPDVERQLGADLKPNSFAASDDKQENSVSVVQQSDDNIEHLIKLKESSADEAEKLDVSTINVVDEVNDRALDDVVNGNEGSNFNPNVVLEEGSLNGNNSPIISSVPPPPPPLPPPPPPLENFIGYTLPRQSSANNKNESPKEEDLYIEEKQSPSPVAPPPPPPPPPIENYSDYTLRHKTSVSGESPKSEHLYIKQKQSPLPATRPEQSSPSRRPSEVYLNDDNVTFGSRAYNNIIKQLNIVFGTDSPPKKLTKPETHEEEEFPAKSNTLKPVMSQIISEIVKAQAEEDDDENELNSEKSKQTEKSEDAKETPDKMKASEEESGVDTRPIAPYDIRKRLNDIFRSDPRNTIANKPSNIAQIKAEEENRVKVKDVTKISNPNTDNRQEHQQKMGNVFATIRLQKVDSFNI